MSYHGSKRTHGTAIRRRANFSIKRSNVFTKNSIGNFDVLLNQCISHILSAIMMFSFLFLLIIDPITDNMFTNETLPTKKTTTTKPGTTLPPVRTTTTTTTPTRKTTLSIATKTTTVVLTTVLKTTTPPKILVHRSSAGDICTDRQFCDCGPNQDTFFALPENKARCLGTYNTRSLRKLSVYLYL